RAPFEPSWAVFSGGSRSFRMRLLIRSFQVTLLRRWHEPFLEMVRSANMRTTDGTIGIAVTGVLDQQFFNQLVERMPEGTYEFVCHPGYNDSDLARVDTGLLASREVELKVLTSSVTRQMLAKRGIELTNFTELPLKS
ncbi:MAG TPA: ChbG/HpnK family deacetylase, partial [Terriglobales bacterium]